MINSCSSRANETNSLEELDFAARKWAQKMYPRYSWNSVNCRLKITYVQSIFLMDLFVFVWIHFAFGCGSPMMQSKSHEVHDKFMFIHDKSLYINYIAKVTKQAAKWLEIRFSSCEWNGKNELSPSIGFVECNKNQTQMFLPTTSMTNPLFSLFSFHFNGIYFQFSNIGPNAPPIWNCSRTPTVLNPCEVCHPGCNTRVHPKYTTWCDSAVQSWISTRKRMMPTSATWPTHWRHKSRTKSVNSIDHTIHTTNALCRADAVHHFLTSI